MMISEKVYTYKIILDTMIIQKWTWKLGFTQMLSNR